MTKIRNSFSLSKAAIVLAFALSCNGPGIKTYNFIGNVLNGATGAVLTNYTITMQYNGNTITGSVNKAGLYQLGSLPAMNDFIITITAAGMRPFQSINRGLRDDGTALDSGVVTQDGGNFNTNESLYFNAYLFPTTLTVPATTLNVLVNNAGSTSATTQLAAGGTVELTPVGYSALTNFGNDPAAIGSAVGQGVSSSCTNGYTIPAAGQAANNAPDNSTGVQGNCAQLWGNTSDLIFSTVTATVTAGVATLPAAQLIYGVGYEITYYGASGYQYQVAAGAGTTVVGGGTGNGVSNPITTTTSTGAGGTVGFTAGLNTLLTIIVSPVTQATLAIAGTTANGTGAATGVGAANGLIGNGSLTIYFNQNITLDPDAYPGNTIPLAKPGFNSVGGGVGNTMDLVSLYGTASLAGVSLVPGGATGYTVNTNLAATTGNFPQTACGYGPFGTPPAAAPVPVCPSSSMQVTVAASSITFTFGLGSPDVLFQSQAGTTILTAGQAAPIPVQAINYNATNINGILVRVATNNNGGAATGGTYASQSIGSLKNLAPNAGAVLGLGAADVTVAVAAQ